MLHWLLARRTDTILVSRLVCLFLLSQGLCDMQFSNIQESQGIIGKFCKIFIFFMFIETSFDLSINMHWKIVWIKINIFPIHYFKSVCRCNEHMYAITYNVLACMTSTHSVNLVFSSNNVKYSVIILDIDIFAYFLILAENMSLIYIA